MIRDRAEEQEQGQLVPQGGAPGPLVRALGEGLLHALRDELEQTRAQLATLRELSGELMPTSALANTILGVQLGIPNVLCSSDNRGGMKRRDKETT